MPPQPDMTRFFIVFITGVGIILYICKRINNKGNTTMKKLIILLAAAMVIGCNANNKPGAKQKKQGGTCNYDIYVLGQAEDTIGEGNGETYAYGVCWKNGVLLADGSVGTPPGYDHFSPNDIVAAKGGPAFLGEAYNDGYARIEFFMCHGGKFTRLGDATKLQSVFLVSNRGKPVAVGQVLTSKNDNVWKSEGVMWDLDGNTIRLEMGDFASLTIHGVTAANGNIYVCGGGYNDCDYMTSAPVVWKNGKLITYGPTDAGDAATDLLATSIAVSGDDIYTAMYSSDDSQDKSDIKLWKNGRPLMGIGNNGTGANASCLVVDGNDVYACGSEDRMTDPARRLVISVPRIWKNGKVMKIGRMEEEGHVNSMTVAGGKLYAAGSSGNNAALWTDGICEPLGKKNCRCNGSKVIAMPAKN